MNPQLVEKAKKYRAPQGKDKMNYVGVEIEFSCPIPEDEAVRRLDDEGLLDFVQIGYDGSPEPGHIGYEWKVLMPQSKVAIILPRVGRLIDSMGGMSNDSCGLHVHIDVRNRDPQKVYNNLVRAQRILFGVAHPRRSVSNWCRPQSNTDIKLAAKGKNAAINPHLSTNKYTIEVRIREGIVDGDDILRWTKLLLAIADGTMLTEDVSTYSALENNIRLSRYIRDYVRMRLAQNKRTDLLEMEVA